MKTFFKMFVAFHVWLYRTTNGKLGSSMRGGKLLLLTTKGRKTGQLRTVPVMYIEDEHGHPVVCASFAGAPENPAWFNNLTANPDVTVELPGKKMACKAVVASPEKRAGLWSQLTSSFPGFTEYTKKTTREFPMVILEPAGA